MRVYNKKIVMCTCGATISQGRKSDHLKTKIHARRLEEITAQESDKVSLPSS
jgi:acetone carboxylase gamma subunit